MRQLRAFFKKELTEQIRSYRLYILGAVFLFFAIMSPATAKLMPKIIEAFSEQQDAAFVISAAKDPTAVDSFDQFFKNTSTALIVFIIMQAGIFTKEYSSGTLLLSLTRGMERRRVIAAKWLTLAGIWTVCYFMSFGVCYGYTVYFWDVSAVPNVTEATVVWWIYGLWYISILTFFSTLINSATGIIACIGAIFLSSDLLGMIPKLEKILPTRLSGVSVLTHGESFEYMPALIVVIVSGVMMLLLSVPVFNKKQI